MTTETPPPDVPVDETTCVARAGQGRRRRGRRADDRGHHRRRLEAAAARAARAVQAGDPDPGRDRRRGERRPAGHPLPGQGGHRHRHPADPRRRQPRAAAPHRGAGARRHADPGAGATAVPRPVRPDRPGRALRAAAPGVRPLPGAEPGLPRRLHLGPGDLPADLRRRRDLRDARDRLRRPGHRRADAGRHRRAAALPRREAGSGRADLRAVPGLAHAWFRRESAKSYKVTREKVALVIVHFVESMGGIRAVQAFRREPRNQEIFDDVNDQYRRANLRRVPAGRVVHARHPADRQRHHRASCCSTAATAPTTATSPSACSRRSCSTCASSSSR